MSSCLTEYSSSARPAMSHAAVNAIGPNMAKRPSNRSFPDTMGQNLLLTPQVWWGSAARSGSGVEEDRESRFGVRIV
jgi:hypothetical protein